MMPKTNTDVYFNSATTIAPLKVSGSFGKGWNYGGTAGYFMLPYLAFELGVNQFAGSTLSSSQFIQINNTQSLTLNESSNGRMLRFCPALKLSTYDGKIPPYNRNTPKDGGSWIDYYVKIGLIIGLSNSINSNQSITHADTTTALAYNTTTVYSGGSSTGFNLKLGVSFKQNDKIFLFVELSFIDQFYAPSQSLITSYSYGGADMLSSLPVSQRQTYYVPLPNSKTGGANEPSQAYAISYPFTSVGLNVGIEFKFNR